MKNPTTPRNLAQLKEWTIPESLKNSCKSKNIAPISAFSTDFQEIIEAVKEEFQVPPSLIIHALLGALSTILQGLVDAPFGHGHIPSSLFLLMQLESGGGKTSVINFIYKSIFDVEERLYTEYIQQCEDLKKLDKESKDGIEPPTDPSFLLASGTIEFILSKFVHDNKINLAWISGEAGLMFGGYSMSKENLDYTISKLADLYSGQMVEYNTRGNKKDNLPTRAYGRRLTIDMSGQPAIIKEVMLQPYLMQQGFLARYLTSFEESTVGKRCFNNPSRLTRNIAENKVIQGFWKKCEEYLLLSKKNESNCIKDKPTRYKMPYGEGSHQFLNNYRQECEDRLLKEFIDYKEAAQRLAENCSRIATLLAYYDGHRELPIDYLRKSKIITEYSINELLFYRTQLQKVEKSNVEKTLDFLKRKCLESHSNILLYSAVQAGISPESLRKKDEFELNLKVLEDKFYIQIVNECNTKRRFIVVNPCLLTIPEAD